MTFINENFMLTCDAARELYHKGAEGLPIIDYHCHLSPQQIADNIQFKDITQLWLAEDHYKWRAMRANGIPEEYVTGKDCTSWEKFSKWAETVPYTMRNPLYHWTHLELSRVFGIDKLLCPATAREIFEECNAMLAREDFRGQSLIRRFGVEVICTTDDPADSLEWHEKLASSDMKTAVLPAWRPDKAVNIDIAGFKDYLELLSKAVDVEIDSLESLYKALDKRLEFFASRGCRIADHGLTDLPERCELNEEEADRILKKALSGEQVSASEANLYKLTMLKYFAAKYTELGWVMQLHYGCKRNNNRRMFKLLGPDTGYDAILGSDNGARLAELLDLMAEDDKLPKTILYSLNPNDNAVIETVMGCFQDSSARCKMQHGSAWWFNDNRDGMEAQLRSLANEGVLGNFVGMLTDSRSFLSYTRHEYFRRILCNLIAGFVENGEYEWDEEILGKIVSDISYGNALEYFGFKLKK